MLTMAEEDARRVGHWSAPDCFEKASEVTFTILLGVDHAVNCQTNGGKDSSPEENDAT
jgi:hypothetical protein